jgi:hypothetical protein
MPETYTPKGYRPPCFMPPQGSRNDAIGKPIALTLRVAFLDCIQPVSYAAGVKAAGALLTALALVLFLTGAPVCSIGSCAPAPSSCCEPSQCECHFDQPAPDLTPATVAAHTPAIPTAPAINIPGTAPRPTTAPHPTVSAIIPGPPLYSRTHSYLI